MTESVRPIHRDDVPAVAEMFTRVFMKRRAAAGVALYAYLEDLLFPASGGEPRSRVFVDAAGGVRGFIGVWPRRMVLEGRTIEAAAAGSLMVDHPETYPTAGARLLRSYLSGPQDLSFSETANAISQRMWEKVGGERLPVASLDWLRVLSPAGFSVATASRAFRPLWMMRPLAAGIDRVIEAAGSNPFVLAGDTAGFRDADATQSEILQLIPELSRAYQLRPDWHSPELELLLSHAQTKERYGELHSRIVYAQRTGNPVACYLYYARRGDTARVLQVLAQPEATGAALDSLFRHAAALGCVGVRGRSDPGLLDALVSRRCVLYSGAAMVIHARNKALLDEVRRSRTLLSGLAGESWNRLIGGSFA
ncbi:MAG: hypothetical protein WC829_14790 [Hyphomicrobium sp.]